MVTRGGSNDTVGPTLNAKRRRRKEQLDEDDSSDLSDESDDDDDINRWEQSLYYVCRARLTRAWQTCKSDQVYQDAIADALWLVAYPGFSSA